MQREKRENKKVGLIIYALLAKSSCHTVDSLDDAAEWAATTGAARQLGSPYEPSTYLDGDDLDLPRPEEEPVDPQFEYTAEGWMRERDVS